ncbi:MULTISPECIES: hypothetical protein [Paenibacillus]|uniref:Uncharacterized protein n=1 Tax=Paenibacillus physcomitrellae TaxID=1619311 RepID=A0ABQ1FYT4_9BACL|nr:MULTISPECIES: hypothetical protein [Paenibacillus]GGA32960.1 hypothetical protein GCM10010917_17580 [Paenibacillus physcomitrellae]
MGQPNEEEIRNKPNKEGDSLAEQKKMENGVDIEPEADEWVAKPVGYTESDTTSKK